MGNMNLWFFVKDNHSPHQTRRKAAINSKEKVHLLSSIFGKKMKVEEPRKCPPHLEQQWR